MRKERLRQSVAGAAATTGVLALWLALSAAPGCGGGGQAADPAPYPVAGCEGIDPAGCDVRTTPCQTRLFAMAACLRGDQAGELPPMTVVSEADFAAILAADPALTTPPPHLATWDWALSSLKLIQSGALAPQARIAMTTTALGIYREDKKDILIVDHGSNFDEQTASTVVVHEMVHALQDRDADLTHLWNTFATSGEDSVLAVRSIVEGEARMQETRYAASVLGLDPAKVDWMRRFENAVTRDEAFLFMQPSLLTASSSLFPYEWGARYVYFRWTAQGITAVQALFQSPPVTTRVLMASVDQALDPEAAPAPPDLPVPPADWTAADTDTMGAWGLFLALGESAPGTAASELQSLALHWQADRLGIYEQSGGATAFVWRVDLGDETTAGRVLQLLQGGLPAISFRQQGSWVVAAGESDQPPGDWAFAP